MSFLEMPNTASEESSAGEVETEGGSRARAENISAIRLRDVKTGKFVAGAGLINKGLSTALDTAAWTVPIGWLGVEKTKSRKKKVKKLDPNLSVGLKKKE